MLVTDRLQMCDVTDSGVVCGGSLCRLLCHAVLQNTNILIQVMLICSCKQF
jgi:hypothetical protein